MRRKVRGTVSGIYMYSAALSVENVTAPCSAGMPALQQNGFSRFAKLAQFVSIRVQ